MALTGAFFFGFIPMFIFAAFVYWLDRYEKEPKLLLGGVFMWGVIISAGGAFILNTIVGMSVYSFTGSTGAADFATTSIAAPIVEETLKGLAVLLVFLVARKEFDSVLDGIVYAAIVAMGFAAVENTLYIYRNGFQGGGWEGFWTLVFIRVVLVGWMHPFFTAFFGIGLAVSRTNPNLFIKVVAIPLGFMLAVATHAFHNTFSSVIGGNSGFLLRLTADYFGYALMIIFIVWMIVHERNILKRQLAEEVHSGAISTRQYFTAISPIQMRAHVNALTSGSFKTTARFYQVLAELAHKKEQISKHGDEGGNAKIIEQLRSEMRTLAPVAKA
jgi:RsiW-degrading membrane proteinase PrsW (M82 family)